MMIKQIFTFMFRLLPKQFLVRMQSGRAGHRLVRWWAEKRTGRIVTGAGAGLKFNAANSNPAYVLGTNETPVQQVLAQRLAVGGVFYDIGANVGFFTVIGARLVGAAGRVYAFEPVPENAAAVRRNVQLNAFQNVVVLEKAVSRMGGQGELWVAEYSGGSALATAVPPPDTVGTMLVDLVAIDDLVAQKELEPPAVVKIDVEGAELDVLKGMTKTIQAYKPSLIYEIDDGDAAAFAQKQAACAAFLHSFGYQITPLADSYPDAGWLVGNFVAAPQ